MSTARRAPRWRTLAILVALSLLAGGTAYAAALNVTSAKLTVWHAAAGCVPWTSTVNPDIDSYVDQDNASSNFGSSALMKVRAQLTVLGIGGNARALIRFALPSIPASCSVTDVRLRVYASASAGSRTLEALRVNASWTEGGVTWNNQPATTGTAATTASGTGYREWTVTSQVLSMYSGANNGFLIRDSAESPLVGAPEQVFDSRTGTNKPELLVTFG